MIDIFLICLIFVYYSHENPIITCGFNKTVILNENDASPIFVESPGFPHSMDAHDKENCMLNVLLPSTKEHYKLMVVITNGKYYVSGGDLYEKDDPFYHFHTNVTHMTMNFFLFSFSFSTTYIPYNKKWDAFQGYILYERPSACPFNKNPFEFKDESQIIYLTPTYFSPKGNPPKDLEPYSCSWTFIGPKDYGFKLVYKKKASNINFSAVNSSGYDIIKGHGLVEDKVYYNGDNFLKINVTDRKYFEAYVTIVKNKWKNPENECAVVHKNKTNTFWSSSNEIYSNNLQCNVTVPIPINNALIVYIYYFDAEAFVDYIQLSSSNHLSYFNKENWPIKNPRFFYTESYDEVIASFVSDGSIVGGGFSVNFENLDCTCSTETIIVPCENDDNYYSILESGLEYVCPNLTCKLKIIIDSECPSMKPVFTYFAHDLGENNGLEVIIDNVIYDLSNIGNTFKKETVEIPLLSETETVIIFDSTKVLLPFQFSFLLSTIDAPTNISPVILTTDRPIHKMDLLWLPENSFFTVDLDNDGIYNNEKMEIFFCDSDALVCFLVYDKNIKKFTHSLDGFLEDYSPYNNSLKSFTIYRSATCEIDGDTGRPQIAGIPIIFRSKYASTEHCVFSNNIIVDPSSPAVTFTAIAKSSGFCKISLILGTRTELLDTSSYTGTGEIIIGPNETQNILKLMHQKILHMYTNSKTEMVTMNSGCNETQNIIKFNKNDVEQWKSLNLNHFFYSFTIPPNASLIIFFDNTRISDKPIEIDRIPFKSFIDTPEFGSYTSIEFEHLLEIYEISNFPVIFRVKDIDLSSDAVLYARYSWNEKLMFFNFTNDQREMTFENTTVKLWYYEPNSGYKGARIFVETLPNNEF